MGYALYNNDVVVNTLEKVFDIFQSLDRFDFERAYEQVVALSEEEKTLIIVSSLAEAVGVSDALIEYNDQKREGASR